FLLAWPNWAPYRPPLHDALPIFPGIPNDWMLPANAFVCALGSVLLLQAATRSRGAGPEMLVLFGIALFFTFNALVAILQFVASRSEEHTSELQSRENIVCRLLLE